MKLGSVEFRNVHVVWRLCMLGVFVFAATSAIACANKRPTPSNTKMAEDSTSLTRAERKAIQVILSSSASQREKGRQLASIVRCGVTSEEIDRALVGLPHSTFGYGAGYRDYNYDGLDLRVSFDESGIVWAVKQVDLLTTRPSACSTRPSAR